MRVCIQSEDVRSSFPHTLILVQRPNPYLVHILSADVIIHKRRLEPIKALIQRICRRDDDALLNGTSHMSSGTATPSSGIVQPAGYFSAEARMYLVSFPTAGHRPLSLSYLVLIWIGYRLMYKTMSTLLCRVWTRSERLPRICSTTLSTCVCPSAVTLNGS